jgi:RHS repeat-associated protein
MAYDTLNRLRAVADERGVNTRYFYDAGGLQTHVCVAKVNGVAFAATPSGTSCDEALENHVEYVYAGDEGARGLRTSHIIHGDDADRTTTFDDYDGEGNLLRVIDPAGIATSFTYDELNRRRQASHCTREGCTQQAAATDIYETRSVGWDYDGNDNVVRVVERKLDRAGAHFNDVTNSQYDLFDRLDQRCFDRSTGSETGSGGTCSSGTAVDYGYDDNGNRTLVQLGARSTVYRYDERNRLRRAEIDGSASEAVIYRYFPDGRVGNVSYPNGASTTYAYEGTGRVDSIISASGATTLASHSYDYDKNGNRTSQTENLPLSGGNSIETTSYDYDTADQLTSFTIAGASPTRTTTYQHEGWNRRTETLTVGGSVTERKRYHYNARQELDWVRYYNPASVPTDASAHTREVAYAYDTRGNTTARTDSATPSENLAFAYDALNQLARTTRAGGIVEGVYDYDSSGLRVRHEDSDRGDVEYFLDDRAVLEERVLGSNTLLAHYRYADRLLRLDTPSGGNEARQYYHHDALGSTVALSNAVGAVQKSYRLDAFGQVRAELGSSVNRRVFTGHEQDENTGLVYAGARYYDPATGRFITQDSYLGEAGTPPSLHRYLYAYGSPTVWTDPTGHTPELDKRRDGLEAIKERIYDDGEDQQRKLRSCADAGSEGCSTFLGDAEQGYDDLVRAGQQLFFSGELAAVNTANFFADGATLVKKQFGMSVDEDDLASARANSHRVVDTVNAITDAPGSAVNAVQAYAEDPVGTSTRLADAAGAWSKSVFIDGDSRARTQFMETQLASLAAPAASKVLRAAPAAMAQASRVTATVAQSAAKVTVKVATKITKEVADGVKSFAKGVVDGRGGRLNPLNYRIEPALSNLGGAPIQYNGPNGLRAGLRVNEPKILSRTDLPDEQMSALRRDFNIKKRAIQSAAHRGELVWSPDTDSVRVPELQAAYRSRVMSRYDVCLDGRLMPDEWPH